MLYQNFYYKKGIILIFFIAINILINKINPNNYQPVLV